MLRKIKNNIKSAIEVFNNNRKLKSLRCPVFVDGFPESKNFGDALNNSLVKFLSGRDVFAARFMDKTSSSGMTSYAVIGSVCQWSRRQSVIWGAGFISETFKEDDFIHPYEVLAVRGPLTRSIYLGRNITCPARYGDPALLLPLLYNPEIEIRYEYGIIPHYVDWDSVWVDQYRDRKDTLIINMMMGDCYDLFVNQLKSCARIVTSSLHGLILAQAYGIPVCAVQLSEGVTGGEFKFKDYLLSVGKEPIDRTDLYRNPVTIESLEFDDEDIQIDLAPLIATCPFMLPEIKQSLLAKNDTYYRKIC